MDYKRNRKPFWRICPLLICIAVLGVGFAIYCIVDSASKQPKKTPEATTEPVVATIETQATTAATQATQTTVPPTTEPPAPQFETVGENYFDDALFVGDSRTDGLSIYSTLQNADFYSGTSMTIFGVLDSDESVDGVTGLPNVLQAKQYGKVYIMFGINEAGYDTDAFAEQYDEVVQKIREYQPDAIIYIQGIMYVTANKAQNEPVFSNDGLREKNAKLKELVNDKDIFYLEVNENFDDGYGNLPSDYTGDGVHLKASYYYLWRDYLLEHAIVTPEMHYKPEETTQETTTPD